MFDFSQGGTYICWEVINDTEDTPRFDPKDYQLIVYKVKEGFDYAIYRIEKNETNLSDKDIAYICEPFNFGYRRRDKDEDDEYDELWISR